MRNGTKLNKTHYFGLANARPMLTMNNIGVPILKYRGWKVENI